MVIDCCCFNYSCMAYVASKSDFQNKDRFENLSCSQCYPFSTTGNIVFAFEKVSYIHVGRLHNADCDCCNLDNVYNFPQVQFDFTSDIFNSGITLALSLVCFGVDYLLYHRKGDVTGKK